MKEPAARDRRPLFGNASGQQPKFGQAASSSVDPESLERQNDQNIGNLGDRVSLLRQVPNMCWVTASIKDEVDRSHRALDTMSADMGSARMGLGAAVSKFKKVFQEPRRKQMAMYFAGAVGVLFIIFLLLRRRL
eukprot:jgi/Astpho2/2630/fgenesh1_pg.00049_%23_11_t